MRLAGMMWAKVHMSEPFNPVTRFTQWPLGFGV